MIYLQMPKVDGKPGNYYLNELVNGSLRSLPVWTWGFVPVHETIETVTHAH